MQGQRFCEESGTGCGDAFIPDGDRHALHLHFIAAGGLYVWREAAFMYHSYGRPGNISSSETSKGRRGDFISSVQDKSGHFYDPFAEYAV